MKQLSPTQQVLMQANKLVASGNPAEAIKLLYPAVKQYPNFYQGWLLFSRCLFETDHIQEARQIAQHAEQTDPAEQEFQQIQRCMQNGQYDEVKDIAGHIIQLLPFHPKACFALASVALNEDDPEQSISVLEPAVIYSPANLTLRKLLAESYVAAGQYAKAISHASCLVSLDECFDSLWFLFGLLFRYGQYEALLERSARARALAGQDASKRSQLDLLLGQTLRILGRREESIRCLKACLTADPANGDAWWALADFKNYRFSTAEQRQLQSLLQRNVSARLKCPAAFALAKLNEVNGESVGGSSETMALYHQANQLKNIRHYPSDNMANEFSLLKQYYTHQSLSVQASITNKRYVPIFIVGLPRAGSTLVEQILASHTQIQGTLEQPTLPAVERSLQRYCRRHYGKGLLPSLDKLSSRELTQFGQAYLDNGALFRREDVAYFTDKQPFNFRHVGLIHKILPQAVILDVRRDPMDCGVSLYKQFFHSGVDFSYDLSRIGKAYNAYVSLMDYWHSALSGKVLQVQYEELVSEPEHHIRRILHHIGLDYDENCINFHQTQRAIHTASSEQVRQPINSNGIGTSRLFATDLSPLKKSLIQGL